MCFFLEQMCFFLTYYLTNPEAKKKYAVHKQPNLRIYFASKRLAKECLDYKACFRIFYSEISKISKLYDIHSDLEPKIHPSIFRKSVVV